MSKEETKVIEAVENEETDGVRGVYKFKKPTTIDGETVTEISYDFGNLNGVSIRKITSELTKRQYFVLVKETDVVFQAALFAEASGLSIDNVEHFSMFDYMAVADIAKVFLIGEE